MTDTFRRLYGATPYDPTDRHDQIGEIGRTAIIEATLRVHDQIEIRGGADAPALLGGLLVGLTQVIQATMVAGDRTDAAIRASIMQLAPWAVDMARAAEGKEPLANG